MDWPTPRSSPWRGAATTWSNCSGRGGFRGLLLLFLLLFRLLAQFLADLLQAHAVVAVLRGVSHAGIILKFHPNALPWFPCKGFPCRAALTAKLRRKRQTAAAWLPRIKSPPSHRLLLLPGVVAQVP